MMRVQVGHSLNKSLRVRMCGLEPKLITGRHLDQFAQIHHRGAMRDISDHAEVMTDKQISDLLGQLEVNQKVQNLSL